MLHLDDGRYALIEFKLGQSEVDEGHVIYVKLRSLLKNIIKMKKQCPLRLPNLKIVITGTQY